MDAIHSTWCRARDEPLMPDARGRFPFPLRHAPRVKEDIRPTEASCSDEDLSKATGACLIAVPSVLRWMSPSWLEDRSTPCDRIRALIFHGLIAEVQDDLEILRTFIRDA